MDPVTFVSNFISAHPHTTLSILGGWFVFSNVVAALPSPDKDSGKGYKFFFAFCHGLSANFPRIFPKLRLPGDPSRSSGTYFGAPTAPPADSSKDGTPIQ